MPTTMMPHYLRVRQIMTDAGFADATSGLATLTKQEIDEQYLGWKAGVSPEDVAEQFIARRRLAMSTATVAA